MIKNQTETVVKVSVEIRISYGRPMQWLIVWCIRFLCLSPALAMNLFCVLGTKSKILLGVYKYMGNLVLSTELK